MIENNTQRINSINPQRIEWCCDDRGISVDDLASAIGIAKSTMDRVLDSGEGITFNQLQRLAEYFNRGVLFFLEPGPAESERIHSPQFRTLASQKPDLSPRIKALIERVEFQRDVYTSLRESLGIEEGKFAPPVLAGNGVKALAESARAWLELLERNDFYSYRKSVEAKGILVFRSNGYGGKWQIPKDDPICGFTVYDASCPVIVVKKQASERRQAFTLMHELGHLLLHQSSFVDDVEDLDSYQGNEREANAFAGFLLVPDFLLTRIDIKGRPTDPAFVDEWLQPFTQTWGVSAEVILRRLLDEERMSRASYLSYRKWKSEQEIPESSQGNRQYRHREPKHVFGEPFVKLVFDALHSNRISLSKASTYLDNLKVSDVHLLEGTFEHI